MIQGKYSLSGPFGILLIVLLCTVLLAGALWMAFRTTGKVEKRINPDFGPRAPAEEFESTWY
jgi:hypothetical protein